jgi:hypothetical protein
MSSLLQRLSLMAGVTLTEAQLQLKTNSSELDSGDRIQERKLTPAELEKREEIALAIEKDQPGIDKSKKMAIATAQAKKLSEAAKEVGWYVTNANDKEVAGPMSEFKARVKARELGGDAKGFAVSYVSDYDNLRASESTEINEAEDHYFFGRTSHDRFKSKAEEIHGPITKGDRNSSGNTPYYDKAGKQIGHHSIDGEGDHTYRVYAKPSVKEATNTMQRYGQKIIQRAKEKAAAEKKLEDAKKSVKEATSSNKVFDDYNAWKGAVEKAGLEVYSDGAADGKYTAKKDGEVYGRFNKDGSGGWLHSSVMSEAAIGEPWVVHLKFRKKGEERTFNSVNHKLNAPDKERAKSYAIADYEKKGYVDVSAVRATPAKAVKEDTNYDDEGNVIPEGPLPQGLAEIARQLGFQTLDTRNSDSLDFKEVSVGGVKSALLAAYNLGKTQATAQATPAEQQPQSGGLPVPQSRTSADHQQAGPVGIAR